MRALLTIPISLSSNRALGSAVGRPDIQAEPALGENFPWKIEDLGGLSPSTKQLLVELKVELLDRNPQVRNVEFSVEVECAIFSSETEARRAIDELEASLGLVYADYF
ncbi:hypothetical protein ACG04R_23290 [Roseateles sp. BYS78W]|uniref:Uncharacterized protein n=1 Tax=Pelomonas candidula TaxID=3299025 RepID=A0ABW7HI78_9BURK